MINYGKNKVYFAAGDCNFGISSGNPKKSCLPGRFGESYRVNPACPVGIYVVLGLILSDK